MSLTTVQRYQVLRLVVPDGTVDGEEQYAFLGLPEPGSFELTSAQKKQILRIPVVDASVSTSDKFAFLGLMEPVNPGGNIVESFNIEWFIDPTWIGNLLPITNDGNISILLDDVGGGLLGRHTAPGVAEVIETEVVGGWGGINAYLGEQQREDKRRKDARKRYKKPRWVLGPNGWVRGDN